MRFETFSIAPLSFIHPTSPYSKWKRFSNREIILDYKNKIDRWDAHANGVIIERDNSLFLNGDREIVSTLDKYGELGSTTWFSHPRE